MNTSKKDETDRATILVVDDDVGNLEILGGLLQQHFDVLIAPSGERALQIAACIPKPDLILLDVLMPGMDGHEVLARLRDDPATSAIPVIFVTGLDSVEDEERGLKSGAMDYIAKPYRPSIICARVRTQLELKRARDWLADQNTYLEAEVARRMKENEQAQLQLLQSEKLAAMGQLAAGIAHEINAPAQYVNNNVQFLKDAFGHLLPLCGELRRLLESVKTDAIPSEVIEALDAAIAKHDIVYYEEEVPDALAQTLEGLERIGAIVRSVKQFAHPGSLSMAATDLNEAMRTTALVSKNEWKYVAELKTDFDPSLPLVDCMISEINQVVLNLIINAVHAISEAKEVDPQRTGLITLSTRANGSWAEIRVSDTAMGIPPEVQPRVFDPFFTTKAVGKGTGQGLAIAHRIVAERHKGQIFFETQPGQGTTFIIRLPIAQQHDTQ
ncbi:MAG: hypothetical protein A2051_02175 [Desulfovibrionales bacterium GWA2_65_9]|nr:MAG: hypothetical protein A2051_02175 [Desulfovibrionales bacterium GWA2_65_9]